MTRYQFERGDTHVCTVAQYDPSNINIRNALKRQHFDDFDRDTFVRYFRPTKGHDHGHVVASIYTKEFPWIGFLSIFSAKDLANIVINELLVGFNLREIRRPDISLEDLAKQILEKKIS